MPQEEDHYHGQEGNGGRDQDERDHSIVTSLSGDLVLAGYVVIGPRVYPTVELTQM